MAQHTSPTSSLAPPQGLERAGPPLGQGHPGPETPHESVVAGGPWAEATCRESRAQGQWPAGAQPGSQVESDRRPPLAGAGAVSGQAVQAVVTSQGRAGRPGSRENKRGSSFRK